MAEYKWGERTWSKRKERARDCGLLLHCHGPDGSFGGAWISCVQAQMLEGSTGDLNVLQGKSQDGQRILSSITCRVTKDAKGGVRWQKDGQALTFPLLGKSIQSIRWKDRDPGWNDVKGYRGAKDVENPVGEWNRMEVICDGNSVQILLNGVLVNEGRNAKPAAGYIGVQNEWAECWFRRLESGPWAPSRRPAPPSSRTMPPTKERARTIQVVSCHAEGEVGDVIVDGVPTPPGSTLWEQRTFIEQDKSLRNFSPQ